VKEEFEAMDAYHAGETELKRLQQTRVEDALTIVQLRQENAELIDALRRIHSMGPAGAQAEIAARALLHVAKGKQAARGLA
jgi:Tfp pilus assembly protein PilO